MSALAAELLVEAYEYHAHELAAPSRAMPPALERRDSERKSIGIRATVTVFGQSILPGTTIDLSLAGASITVPFELAQGQRCLIDLELEACGVTSAFHIPAEVRYCVQMGKARFRAGMRFGELDSATTALIDAVLVAPLGKAT
jgi:hypothetical protein